MGEKYVYDYLVGLYGVDRVNWVSENAKLYSVNPEGSADRGYDMEYTDKKGNRRFVEVKSSVADADKGISFYLSESEYSFGVNNSQNYEVLFIANVMGDKPELIELKDVFVDNRLNDEIYMASVKEYLISTAVKHL